MRSCPFLLVAAAEVDLDAAEDWLAGQLAEDAAAGSFLGLRIESPFPGAAHLILSFRDVAARDAAERRLAEARRRGSAPALVLLERGEEADRDWVAASEMETRALPLGRRYQALPGDVEPLPHREAIRVPRSRAFGTGEHASTRLAAALLEEQGRPGAAMLDLGCGTALLAALAHLAGARPVLALDIDPDAAAIAARTVRENGLENCLVACGGIEAILPGLRFATLAANIERDTLLALLPQLARRVEPDGRIILSGLLEAQAPAVLEEAAACGLAALEQRAESGWTGLVLAPHPTLRPRVLVEPGAVAGDEAPLGRDEAHHLARVRRVRDGAPVQALDGEGRVWGARLRLAPGGAAHLVGMRPEEPGTETVLEVTLLQALPEHGGWMEEIVRQATELGVHRIVPLLTERGRSGGAGRGERSTRLRRIACEALKQCGRVRSPRIETPVRLDQALAEPHSGPSLVLDPFGAPLAARLRAAAPERLRLLVGPEGGLSPRESAAAREAGFAAVSLGPRILRAPTAAVAAVAAVMSAWGCGPPPAAPAV